MLGRIGSLLPELLFPVQFMPILRARFAAGYKFFVLGSLIGAWASRVPDIKANLGLSEGGLGLLLLCMATGATIALPISGAFTERFGAARTAKLFSFLLLVFFILLPLVPTFTLMLPYVFVFGLTIGMLDVSMNGWGAEVEERLAKPIMSSFHGLYSLGAGVGAAAGAFALEMELSLFVHFALWGVLNLLPAIFAILTPWVRLEVDEDQAGHALFALPKGALLFVGLMALAAALAEGANTDWGALYQIKELGIDPANAATSFSVFSIAMLITRMMGDRIVERYGAVQAARVSGVLACVGTLLFVWGPNLWMIWFAIAVMGVGYALIFPLAISRAASQPGMSRGVAIASVATLGYGAFLMGPPLLGFLAEFVSLRFVFLVVASTSLVILLFARHFEKPVRPAKQPKG